MSQQWSLVAPVPQWAAPARWRGCNLEPGFRVSPMTPQVRRVLLNATKEAEATGKVTCDELLKVLVSAETVMISAVPPRSDSKDGFSEGLIHQFVADGVLRRLHECVLLFAAPGIQDLPQGFWHSPWFLLRGTPVDVSLEQAKCLASSWKPDVFRPWDFVDPIDVSTALVKARKEWTRISRLCRIDAFVALDTDAAKLRGYVRAGQANAEREAKAMMQARLAEAGQESGPLVVSRRQSAIWHFEGVRDAIRRAVDKLDAKFHPRGSRLSRAFQFFQDSFRLDMPHSFVSLAICLESLLSLGNDGITSQLAVRVGWLLEPRNARKRTEMFSMAKTCYDFRSRIVHGGPYKADEAEVVYYMLLYLTRNVLAKIISSECLFEIFFNEDAGKCDAMLKRLLVGSKP